MVRRAVVLTVVRVAPGSNLLLPRVVGGGHSSRDPRICGPAQRLNRFGNWATIPLANMSAIPRIWTWIWS